MIAGAYVRVRTGGWHAGDCLGAVQQLSELAFLLAGLAVLGPARQIASLRHARVLIYLVRHRRNPPMPGPREIVA